jgi:hypothetical protein
VFTVITWSGHLKLVALPFFLAGAWSALEGISLQKWVRVGHAILSGHGWWWSMDGDSYLLLGSLKGRHVSYTRRLLWRFVFLRRF